jgi:hypothetical protein
MAFNKSFLLSLSMLVLCTFSDHALADNATCRPSSINNYVPCDAGYTGQKFTTTSKTCPDGWPSGIVKTTPTYNTSQCVKVIATGPVDRTCELTPAACAPVPASPGCAPNQHWVMTGSPVAHCVDKNPVCPWGTSLVHDSTGNPSCQPNTCPSNQVLQGDGISCACPGGTAWTGSGCVALPPPCSPSTSYGGNVACGAGFTGFKNLVTTISCPGNTTSSYWDTSSCTPIVVPPSCTPSSVIGGNVACGTGFTGMKHSVTTTTCPENVTTTSWDTSACVPIPNVCANGATDYPTCTPREACIAPNVLINGVCTQPTPARHTMFCGVQNGVWTNDGVTVKYNPGTTDYTQDGKGFWSIGATYGPGCSGNSESGDCTDRNAVYAFCEIGTH